MVNIAFNFVGVRNGEESRDSQKFEKIMTEIGIINRRFYSGEGEWRGKKSLYGRFTDEERRTVNRVSFKRWGRRKNGRKGFRKKSDGGKTIVEIKNRYLYLNAWFWTVRKLYGRLPYEKRFINRTNFTCNFYIKKRYMFPVKSLSRFAVLRRFAVFCRSSPIDNRPWSDGRRVCDFEGPTTMTCNA